MKNLLLLATLVLCLASQGCLTDPNEAHRTSAGYYQFGFDCYTMWYNPTRDLTFEVSFMGKIYKLDPYELMIGNPESQSAYFKIWEYDYDWQKENPIKISLGRGVDSKFMCLPQGTQLRIVLTRGGCEFEPIYWTLE